MGQTLRFDAERVRRAGRFGDSVLAHITPSQSDLLMLNGGSGTINPKTGLKEHFSFGGLLSAIAPAALSIFAPGIGSTLGTALGATGATASILGNALVGGGLGAITGGKRGALTGALTSGAFSAASESGLFKGIGDSLGFGSTPDASGAATGGASGGGEADARGLDMLKTEIAPSSGGQTPLMAGGLPQLPGNQVLASLATPGDADTFLASQQVANAQAGSPAGAGGLPPDWASKPPEMTPTRPAEPSFFEKNKTPLLMGAGLLALNGLGGEAQAQQQGAAAAPQGGSWGGSLPKYELDREQIPLTDAELRAFGQSAGGARTGRFFSAPNRYRAMQEGGKVKRPSREEDARNDPLRRNPPKVRNADDPDYEKMPAYPGLEQFRKPGAWRGDDIFPNSKPASRPEYADGGSVKAAAARVAAAGRGGDKLLAHINPEEAELLLRHGGSGTINPKTGVLEFMDEDGQGTSEAAATGAGTQGYDTVGGGYGDVAGTTLSDDEDVGRPVMPDFVPEPDNGKPTQVGGPSSGFFGRVGDKLHDMMNNPFSTLANLALSATIPGYALANAITGLTTNGRSLAGLGVDAARSMAAGIGQSTAPSSLDVSLANANGLDKAAPGAPPTAPGDNQPDFAQSAVRAAGQGAAPASATVAGDQAAQAQAAANGWGRTALDNSNVDWTTFGQSNGGREQGTFFDAPGMRAMEEGGEVSDGRTDDIPARLSHNEHVIDAETVALLGNGDSDAGHKQLENMKASVRAHKGKKLARGKISPDAKKPLQYMKRGIAA